MTPQQRRAVNTFFLRVGQAGQVVVRDEFTLPLIPLWLILDADGVLAGDARRALGNKTVRQ